MFWYHSYWVLQPVFWTKLNQNKLEKKKRNKEKEKGNETKTWSGSFRIYIMLNFFLCSWVKIQIVLSTPWQILMSKNAFISCKRQSESFKIAPCVVSFYDIIKNMFVCFFFSQGWSCSTAPALVLDKWPATWEETVFAQSSPFWLI